MNSLTETIMIAVALAAGLLIGYPLGKLSRTNSSVVRKKLPFLNEKSQEEDVDDSDNFNSPSRHRNNLI